LETDRTGGRWSSQPVEFIGEYALPEKASINSKLTKKLKDISAPTANISEKLVWKAYQNIKQNKNRKEGMLLRVERKAPGIIRRERVRQA